MATKPQKVGLITATSLVIGNMIGVGIFVLPAALAKFGSISLLGWVFTGIGSIILAKIFSNFSKIVPNKSGGPYAFTRNAFGDFWGFFVAWGYWIATWIGNAAIVVGIVGALSFFFPELDINPLYSVSLALALIWSFGYINSRGIKESGVVQVVTTILKLLPLAFVIIVGFFFIDFSNFPAFNLTGKTDFVTIPMVAMLTVYAFLGIECATVPAENIKNPEKIVPRATMIGTILTTIIYILATVVLFGILPTDDLQSSAAPFAKAAELISGSFGGYMVAIGIVISGLGVLNGWTLIVGQLPMATAKDNLFPKIFKRENKNGAPVYGLVISSLLTSGVMLMGYTKGLVDQFEFIVQICAWIALLLYAITCLAYIVVVYKKKTVMQPRGKSVVLGILGLSFSLWAIFGSDLKTMIYGTLFSLTALPFYVLMLYNKRKKGVTVSNKNP